MKSLSNIRRQAGVSLISLMIASAIGFFIIGGAGKVYVDSKNTFNARSALAAATENYRFAFQDMRRVLVMAGRGIIPENDNDSTYGVTDNGLRTFPEISTDGIQDIDSNGSSVIAVRYASGPAPCGLAGTLGGTVADTITVRFYLNADGDLICEVPERNYAQPLVSGIARMRALYGIDTDGDGLANQYFTATAVDDEARWVNVVAIRIGIVAGSGEGQELPEIYRPSTAEPMDVMGATFTPTETSRAYKSSSTTITLRNLRNGINRQAT
ncbi:MAG: PilW family protein [Candidatus Thiodiazotropha taylori]|nr:PilW family protein [Candidatus Thiodiazotropha taylori]MCG8071734.1 PilW family protein [Candidatus Thiodiazotropha taylori]MCW4325749.1 PilW family protein [Candidatus Thiodiazotropha taylori]